MPCYLCETKSEMFPRMCMYKTYLMSTAIPFFNEYTDFLCPNCYLVYYEVIEYQYGPVIRKVFDSLRAAGLLSAPPPLVPPPPEPILPPGPVVNYTAYSSRFAPRFVEYSLLSARDDIWRLRRMDDPDEDLPWPRPITGSSRAILAAPGTMPRAAPRAAPRIVARIPSRPVPLVSSRVLNIRAIMPPKPPLEVKEEIIVPPIVAFATMVIDISLEESKACLRRQREKK